jgi:chemotaxis protein MotB
LSRTRHSTGRRRRKHDEHANHEAWAIPYGDLVTLLLAFFVVMYAISSVNAGKYRVLSDSLFAAFRGTPRTLQPIQVGEKQVGTGADMNATVIQQAMLDGRAQSRLAPVPVAVGMSKSGGNSQLSAGQLPAQAAAAAAALSHVADEVARAMDQLVRKDMVTIRRNDFWIEVEMRTDILFPSGSARLADGAVDIIERLGDVLSPFPNPIRVEGHTDNKPIKTAVFYSNWELSAARAGSVVRVLANHGVAPDRLAVIGYGEQRPIQTNDTSEGRNANRRVVVVILSTEVMRQPPSAPAGANAGGGAPSDQPAVLQPAVAQPGVAQPAVAQPAEALPAVARPAAAQPAEAEPAGTQPAVAHPAGDPAVVQPPAVQPAIALPGDLAQPPAPTTKPRPATLPTARNDIQHNTGTEPAP